ncbi:PREDICTED: uncharacterized protein LOC108769527 [Trachymyrmex cornetzi]|uniref:uncharacterized protein LOC108769527 n=1 Tax=Trachymyrmex cornetzi TaxID=471704 RepID=UPI00084EF006|nr:PREDICTED: uncharacterized protein LOC108769527 [Trachymyrmex cornetzi]
MFFKLIGLATFAHRIVIYKKRTSYTFQYCKLGIAYNVVLSSLIIASNYMSIPFRLNMDYRIKTNLTVGISILQTVLGALVVCVSLISYCINQKSLVRIANRLITVEHEIDHLYDLYHPLRRQRIFRTTIIVCILKICILILLQFTKILIAHTGPVSLLIDILPTFHVGWLLIQYFLLVTVIQTDFADVNRAIQSLTWINAPDLRLQSLYQTRRIVFNNSTVHQLLLLRDVHCHLCEISEDVSSFYSLPIKKTGNIVHDILNHAIEKETKAELKKFSFQLLHRKIQFTANGYFTLDNTFLHSLIGTVMTYLVILVQFQLGSSRSLITQ